MSNLSPAEIMRAHLDTFGPDVTYDPQPALRDDLADARRTTATYRGIALAALEQLHAATVEIERQRRQLAEMREELRRFTAGQV